MRILSFQLGQLQTNCYFIIEDDKCLIIDPADEADFILEKIQQLKLTPVALLATHGHFDHVMAAGEIQLSYDIPFYIHQKDLFLLDRLESTAKYYLGYQPAIIKPKNIKILPLNMFHASCFMFHVILTPGHTPGSVSLFSNSVKISYNQFKSEIRKIDHKNSDKLTTDPDFMSGPISTVFTGDTLFKSAIGRYDFSYSSKKDLDKSLQKLFKLPPKTIVYPGHGEMTTIGEEKINNII